MSHPYPLNILWEWPDSTSFNNLKPACMPKSDAAILKSAAKQTADTTLSEDRRDENATYTTG